MNGVLVLGGISAETDVRAEFLPATQSVVIFQDGLEIEMTLDQLLDAGRWAERIKAEANAPVQWQGNHHQKPPMSEERKATMLDMGTLAGVDPYAHLNPMSRGVAQSNYPEIPEGWERFTTLEEWRGGEWLMATSLLAEWQQYPDEAPEMIFDCCYIQRVKE
jgi:hypothetical protein